MILVLRALVRGLFWPLKVYIGALAVILLSPWLLTMVLERTYLWAYGKHPLDRFDS